MRYVGEVCGKYLESVVVRLLGAQNLSLNLLYASIGLCGDCKHLSEADGTAKTAVAPEDPLGIVRQSVFSAKTSLYVAPLEWLAWLSSERVGTKLNRRKVDEMS